ncbi:MAG: peptide transporter substrate-binding protein, partial [Candidatus Eremiobacteraeota bacterium]|nr:peptide transporter substrate-binding protein [Candidatus Eremiobacteraeota bacterium]
DRVAIQQKLNHGVGIVQEHQLTPSSPYYRPIPLVPYDPAQGNRILDAAGWKPGADGVRAKNGVRLAFDVAAGAGAPDVDQRLELLRSTWKQIGVTFTVRHYDQALLFGPAEGGGIVFGGKFDILTAGWGQTPDADMRATASCELFPPHGENISRYCDKTLEAILTRERAAYDEGPRTETVTAAMRRISELAPYFVLYVQENVHAHTGALTGWKPNSTTPFDNFSDADVGA